MSLQIRDVLGIAQADIDLSRPINLILGRNGTGKSTVRDAIQYALLGRCRSTDGAGRGAESLIRRGANSCSVELTVLDPTGEHQIRRGRNPSGGSGVKGPTPLIGELSSDLVEALLDMPHLLCLSTKERSTILSSIISPGVPLQEVQRHGKAAGLSKGAMASLVAGLQRISDGPYGPAELEEAYKRCYDARREKKRELGTMEAKLQAIPPSRIDIDAGAVRKSLEDLEAEEASIREKIGSLRQQEAHWRAAQDRRKHLENQARELKARPRQPQQNLPMGPSIDDLVAELDKLRDTYRTAEKAELEAVQKRMDAETEAKSAWVRVVHARDGDASCPAHVTDDPCPVLLPKIEQRKAEVPKLQAAAKKAETLANKFSKAEKLASSEKNKALQALQKEEAELAAAREAAARSEGSAEGSMDAIEAELDRIEADHPATADPSPQMAAEERKLIDLAARKQGAQEKLAAIDSDLRLAKEREAIKTTAADLRSQVSIFEELVAILEPRGLPARILAEQVTPFERMVNAQLATITGGEYRIAIRSEQGIDLDVFRGRSSLPLPPENLSTSERVRLGVAMAQAVSIASGLRILVIDEAEMLDPGNRGLLLQGVQALTGQIETTIILATADRPMAVTSDQLGVFWTADGTVLSVVDEASTAASRVAGGGAREGLKV